MMIEKIKDKLKELTNHSIVELTSRGNTAIFAALYLARQYRLDKNHKITRNIVLIPDQGGWFTYKKYPGMLALEPIEIETDNGIININKSKKTIINNKILCLLYANPAGYFAEQPYKEIFDVLNKNKIICILDVTGCIGNGVKYGDYADILVCSFGGYKPADVGYGGFVSIKGKEVYEKGKEIFNTDPFDESYSAKLLEKLNSLEKRYQYFNKINKKIKNDLNGYDIIHKGKKGINVIVRYKTELEKERLINYCKKNSYPYKLCPMYIKVKEKAISIEVQKC